MMVGLHFAQGNRYLTYKVSKALRLIFPRQAAADKSQLISKGFFGVLNEMFVRIAALASKMGIITQIKALYHIKYPLISISITCSVHLFLFIWSILEARADILTKISLVSW